MISSSKKTSTSEKPTRQIMKMLLGRCKLVGWARPLGHASETVFESTTNRTAGGLDFTAIDGKRQGSEAPQSLRVEPGGSTRYGVIKNPGQPENQRNCMFDLDRRDGDVQIGLTERYLSRSRRAIHVRDAGIPNPALQDFPL